MFKRLYHDDSHFVTVSIEGRAVCVPASDTVAAAMLVAGVRYARTTPLTLTPRAPYCMTGACFECLVEIDGVPNQQACRTQVQEGMKIRIQEGARRVES